MTGIVVVGMIVVFVFSTILVAIQKDTFQSQKDAVTSPGRSLAKKFAAFGKFPGKSKTEIIAAVGSPNAISALAGGKSLLQWQATGYHVALRFNGDVCEGIVHEHLVRR